MANGAGRLFLVKKNGTTLAGGRTTSMTVNGSPIDTSDQGDGGKMTYLDGVFVDRSLEIAFEGLVKDKIVRAIALGPDTGLFMDDITIEFPDGDEISGPFILSGYSENGPYKDAQTVTATFISDGAWTYTAAP